MWYRGSVGRKQIIWFQLNSNAWPGMADQRHSRWGGCFLLLAICMLCVKNGTAYTFNPSRRISALQPIQNVNRVIRDSINFKASSSFKVSVLKSELSSDSQDKAVIVPFLNIANVLTISRVIAIPFLMLAFVMRRVRLVRWRNYQWHFIWHFLDGKLMPCEEPSIWVKHILKLADNSLYGMYIILEITRSVYLRGILSDWFLGRIFGSEIQTFVTFWCFPGPRCWQGEELWYL